MPVPREHGAWMMLYAPLVTGLIAFRVTPLPAVLLLLTVTSVFFAQNAVGLQLRARGGATNSRWLVVFVIVAVAAGGGLLVGSGLWVLLPLAVPALLLFSWQAWQRRVTHRQIDHSTINEFASATVMALGGSAAYLTAGGAMALEAALPWAAFALYFGGSVLHVKVRVKDARSMVVAEGRWRQGLTSGLYHGGFGVVSVALAFGPWPDRHLATLVGIAVAPAILRSWIAWSRLDGSRVSLQRLGFIELGAASWFSLWIGVALALL